MSRFSINACFRALGLACCVGLAAIHAQASLTEISPVRADLSASARVAVLTVRNAGEDETVMQVSLMRWPTAGVGYAAEPSSDLLITPTTFRLASGAQQIVRVGLRGNAPLQTETAYRLIIEEVPTLQELDTTRMRLVVRHDLPVFVAPTASAQNKVRMVIVCAPEGAGLHMRNLGNSHLKVLHVTLVEPVSGNIQGEWKTFEYLLSGGETKWLLRAVAPDAKALTYTATVDTEQGSFSADVQNQCP